MRLLKAQEDRLRYEFLPAAEEIVETPASPFGRVVLWLITLLLIVALTWSYFGKLDIIAPATGKVVPEGSIKTVQPASSGVVTDIQVTEGQKVKKGDLLIQLDNSIATSDAKSAEQALTVARLEREMLAKIQTHESIVATINAADLPDDVKQDLIALSDSKASVSAVQKQLLSTAAATAQRQVEMQKQSKQAVVSNQEKLRTREQTLKKELETATTFSEPGLRNELRSVQQQIDSIEISLVSYDQQIIQSQASANEATSRLNSYEVQDKATSYTSVIDSDKRIAELESALVKAKQIVEQLSIRAPVDGTILSLSTKTVGGVVSAGQPVVEIVPEGSKLVIDATVQNRDVGFIQVDQPVVVKVDAYSFQRYGYLKGIVKSISPDAVNDDKQGLVYKMKVEIESSETSKQNTIQIEPGMSVTAEITTGKRRIIEFFLDPLITHTDSSLEVR